MIADFQDILLRTTAIAAAALTASYLLRKQASAHRIWALLIGLGLCLVSPFMVSLSLPIHADLAAAGGRIVHSPSAMTPSAVGAAPGTAMGIAATIYIAIGAVLAILFAISFVRLKWIAASADVVTAHAWIGQARRVSRLHGIKPPAVLMSEFVRSPVSFGWRKPVILLDHATVAQPEVAESVLAHEIAHISRRDWLLLVAVRTASILLWFNPLIIVLSRHILRLCEEAADERALSIGVERVRYADTLFQLARRQSKERWLANAVISPPSSMAKRIRSALNFDATRQSAGYPSKSFAVLLSLGIAPLATVSLEARPVPVSRTPLPVSAHPKPVKTAPARGDGGPAAVAMAPSRDGVKSRSIRQAARKPAVDATSRATAAERPVTILYTHTRPDGSEEIFTRVDGPPGPHGGQNKDGPQIDPTAWDWAITAPSRPGPRRSEPDS